MADTVPFATLHSETVHRCSKSWAKSLHHKKIDVKLKQQMDYAASCVDSNRISSVTQTAKWWQVHQNKSVWSVSLVSESHFTSSTNRRHTNEYISTTEQPNINKMSPIKLMTLWHSQRSTIRELLKMRLMSISSHCCLCVSDSLW